MEQKEKGSPPDWASSSFPQAAQSGWGTYGNFLTSPDSMAALPLC